ncbi:MAG: hypothetical protein ACR2IE_01865 [Candidatus Sumerlaeaceae bacterium]
MLDKYPKAVKKEIIRLIGVVYERELRKAQFGLLGDFAQWEAGELDAFELNERIHVYHDETARELWKRMGTVQPHADLCVAAAVRDGVLKREEVTQQTRDALESLIRSGLP